MLNKAILIGRLGADPELKYTPTGTAVANFNLATSEKRKDKEYTEWHRVVIFDKLAEICAEYLKKGSLIFIEGRLQTRQWEDKDGIKRTTTEIVANNMKMLGPKKEGTPDSHADNTDDVPF